MKGIISGVIGALMLWGASSAQATVCDQQDDRLFSAETRVGRLVASVNGNSMCTATLIGPSCVITAGHCESVFNVLEFRVPMSQPNGRLNSSDPRFQYHLDPNFIQKSYRGMGRDWAVLKFQKNAITGYYPGEVQSWYSVSFDPPALGSTLRIVGYGTSRDEYRGVQRAHFGILSSGGHWKTPVMSYRVDTMGGNSGSSVVDAQTGYIVGIHTNGGCHSRGGVNHGTSIAYNPELQAAVTACLQSERVR